MNDGGSGYHVQNERFGASRISFGISALESEPLQREIGWFSSHGSNSNLAAKKFIDYESNLTSSGPSKYALKKPIR